MKLVILEMLERIRTKKVGLKDIIHEDIGNKEIKDKKGNLYKIVNEV